MPPSIRSVLLVALFVLGGWGAVTSLQQILDSRVAYRQSLDVTEDSRIAADLLVAARHLAYEMGRTAEVLRGADPVSSANEKFIWDHRRRADRALADALAALASRSTAGDEAIGPLWSRLQELRQEVDLSLPLPLPQRDATLAQRWFESANDAVHRIQEINQTLVGRFPPGHRTTRLALLAASALELRITAGVEASYIAQALSAARAPEPEQLHRIYELRGRGDRLWQEIQRLGSYSRIETLMSRIDSVQRYRLKQLRPLQNRALGWLTLGDDSRTISLDRLNTASLPTLDGIADLMTLANQEALRVAGQTMAQARGDLVGHGLRLLAILLLLAFTVYYLLTRVVSPLEKVDSELLHLDALPPESQHGSEIDRLRAIAATLERSLAERDEAQQRLHIANETLEERVRERTEALRASEEKYRALIEGANDAVFVHEVDENGMPGPFIEVNELACRQLGYSREELARLTPMDLDDPACRDRIPDAMHHLLTDGRVVFETAQITKHGHRLPVEVSARLLELGGRQVLFSLVRDITERKWAENALLRLNRELRAISKINQALIHADDPQWLLDEVCRIICEDAGYRVAWVGYREQDEEKTLRPVAHFGYGGELLGQPPLSWEESTVNGHSPAGIAMRTGKPCYLQDLSRESLVEPWCATALKQGYRSGIALPLKEEHEGLFGVLLIYSTEEKAINREEARLLDELAGDLAYGIVALRNRAERRRAEADLRAERGLFVAGPTVVFRWRAEPGWPVDYVSSNVEEQFGYTPESLRSGALPYADLVHAEDLERVVDEVSRYGESGHDRFTQSYRIRHANGEYRWIDDYTVVLRGREGEILSYLGYMIDITERMRSDERLTLLDFALSKVRDEFFLIGKQGQFVDVNDQACRALQYSRQELLEMTVAEVDPLFPEERWGETLLQIKQAGFMTLEGVHRRRDGSDYPVEVSVSYFTYQGEAYLLALARDISERKAAEREMLRINRFLRTLSRCNETLVHAKDQETLLRDMCGVVVEVGGFALAWVGLLDEGGSLRVAAHTGRRGEEYLGAVERIDPDGEGESCRPVVRALHSGEVQVVQESAADPCRAWRERALHHGYRSAVSLPLLEAERVIGAISIYADESGGFGEQEVAVLSELAEDMSYGIHALTARSERERFISQLQRSMHSTIQALASTVELRDPFTAGHQRRVARLAAAVSQAAGLSEEQVEIVFLCGLVHDIGKVAVPAEILSRPGKLSKNEMLLVREHANSGYEILQGVEFPWPIAEIVRQHHERMDGSGYPRGLSGEKILPEARVLAVCDVIEAMTAHRPYRPAVSLEAALAELQQGSGTLYDPELVNVCDRLLREEGFSIDAG